MAPKDKRGRHGKRRHSKTIHHEEKQISRSPTDKKNVDSDRLSCSEGNSRTKKEPLDDQNIKESHVVKKRKKLQPDSSNRDDYKTSKHHQDGQDDGHLIHQQQSDIWGEEGDRYQSSRVRTLCDRPQAFKTDEDVLLILAHPSVICFKGRCHVTSLCGKVSILGYHVTPTSGSCDFYSPESNSLLTINTLESETKKEIVSAIFDKYLDKKDRKNLPKQQVVILLLSKQNSLACDYISKLIPFQSLFSVSEYERVESDVLNTVDIALITEELHLPHVKISDDFQFVADKWTSALTTDSVPVIVVCGGKNSGKSTLNRFLLNTALNKFNKVCYLECDVGQTEFTPPGCVALHLVEEPVLGPPFCHQRHSNYVCYFGGNSPADDPDSYISCLKQCFNYYTQMDNKLPLLVNTMGWNKGLGLDLMVDTLRLVNPDILVQLDCYNQSLNFPALTPEFIAKQQGWISKSQMLTEDKLEERKHKHKLIIIESIVDQQEQLNLKLKPLDHRNLSILGYLNQSLEPEMTLTTLPAYSVPWNAVAIHVIHEVVPHLQIMYALNASMVALCKADLSQAYRDNDDSPWWFKRMPIQARCIGFGIVRGIDPENKQIYIVTPLSPLQLKQVNTIIRGTTNIPDQVFLKQKYTGELPYVDITTSTTGASALRQRRHMPRKYNTDFT